ncbi:hypothetical protein HG536_0G04040 [Torulaspora globosa]|uniref:Uncharacterized protein n=1 Tax=Torulaspora globosa TaxID=48254 RepID=A0A7G3ZM06_9SACH|nr:uncharacterized protein HG536_0G04040 [Torulaspora globosa]QLL34542.1 hypothetical protein HG536_0G04040 [Torulaspora globosa]
MESSKYYTPANVFRQPAIIVKKRSGRVAGSDTRNMSWRHSRSWQNDASRLGSPLLRKVSDDFNDFYTTKKLESSYWRVNDETKSASLPASLSVVDDALLISDMESRDNLKLMRIEGQANEQPSLHELQAISVPGTPIFTSMLLPRPQFTADYVDGHDQLLLTGHQDGVVNLISTSTDEGNAKIVKRYKHGKFLSHRNPVRLDNWLQSFESLPVRKLKFWSDRGFVSLVNDSLFIYDINGSRTPQYLQSFAGVESFAINKNPYLLSLCGSQFGGSGVALLDLRSDQKSSGSLYIPDNCSSSSLSRSSLQNSASYDCVWIDEFHLANCINDTVKVWDIRSSTGDCKFEMLPMKGCIQSLKYHEESKTLYTADDQGFIISWDMKFANNMKRATLAQGFSSIVLENDLDIHDISQCGNIVVNGTHSANLTGVKVQGSVFMDTLSDGSLLTLGSRELGLHRICDVRCQASTEKTAETSLEENTIAVQLEAAENDNRVAEESDFTFLSNDIDMSSLSMHSDCSSSHTLHSEPGLELLHYEKQPERRANSNIYSLSDIVLSGSTIYH